MKPSDKLIQTIKDQHIQPLPRWRFRLRSISLWSVFLLAVLLGALAFSVILFAIQQTDFNMISHLSHSRLELFLGLLPFFWILLLVSFLTLAMYTVQHSRKGYKFGLAKLAGYSAALNVLLGTLFFISGGGHQLEHAFAVNFVQYEGVEEKKARLWTMPEEGYLCGDIEKIDESHLHLHDFKGQIWSVSYADAFVHGAVFLKEGERIKLIGKMTAENQFAATEIRPWGGPGGPGGPRWKIQNDN